MSTFDALLHSLAGSDIRVIDGQDALTGDVLLGRVARMADRLADGSRRVASRLDNGVDWLVLDLAIRALDLVHVPLPQFFTPSQVAHALAAADVDTLVTHAISGADALLDSGTSRIGDRLRLQRLSRPGARRLLPAGTRCITFTSGTTGQPKGVCLGADALLDVAGSLVEATRSLAPRRHLCLMPLATLLENVAGVYAAMIAGSRIAVPPLSDVGYSGSSGLAVDRLLSCLQRFQPHSAIVFPQLLLALVTAAEQGAALPASLRFLAVGGGRVAPGLLARAQTVGLPVFEGYGLTECASVVCLNRPGAVRPGSVGTALPHARVSVDDGELFFHGIGHLGYLGEAGRPPGPVATGDLGHIDDEGFVHVTGRRKHMFITAYGRNVSPEWVESELLLHPVIAQAAVTGEGRPFNVAVVWPRRPGASEPEIGRAIAEVNRGLPDYAQVADYVTARAPFTVAEGLLTANGRPRRDAIFTVYARDIERRYSGSASIVKDTGT